LKKIERDVVQDDKVTAQEKVMGKNVQISLASRLQDMSSAFRREQSNYLQSMSGTVFPLHSIPVFLELRGREAKGGANDILAGIDFSEEQTFNMASRPGNFV
jgi:hypothetical protein